MNLTYFNPQKRENVENINNSPVNIRFVTKTSHIRNLFNTSDLMLKHQKWQHGCSLIQ